MSEKIEVVRVKPCDLSKGQVFRLNYQYKTELGNFVVLDGEKANKLYVNESVPEEDIQKFQQMCRYDGDCINDDDCPIANVCDYVYEKYGYEVWSALIEVHRKRRDQRKKEKARMAADGYLERIKDYRMQDDIEINFCNIEYLLYELSMRGIESESRTVHNLVGKGTEYVFWFGLMLGKGIINEGSEEWKYGAAD